MSKKTRKKRLRQENGGAEAKPAAFQNTPKPAAKKVRYEGKNGLLRFYFNNYKALFIIPIIILALAIGQIAYQYSTTGDFINKGVSLEGGTTFRITEPGLVIEDVEDLLISNLPEHEYDIKMLREGSSQIGVTIETDASEGEDVNSILNLLTEEYGLSEEDYNVNTMGSSLGDSFFKQIFRALVLAFIFMAVVVFIYFRTFAPSIAVVLAALSDIVVTMAITNIMGMKLSTAGIAAFLMLIGYSVDTDILLTTKVVKAKDGDMFSNILRAMKTGMTMTLTTLVAVTVALIVAESPQLIQIMTIILIGLIVDIINTWIQNVAIIRFYLERRDKGDGQ